jgi:hypothetical protein
MQDKTPRATGILARLRAHLRGDRFMAGWSPAASAAPEPKPDPVAVAPEPSRGKEA